jgi:hypothetical protein
MFKTGKYDRQSLMFKAYAGLVLAVPVYLMYSFIVHAYKASPSVKEGLTSSELSVINEQTLNDIQRLQDLEKELYAKMEGLSATGRLTQTVKDDIVAKINNLTQLRMNLYSNLKNNYDLYQITAITTSNTYDEQTAAISIVEKELNAAKEKLQSMEEIKMNKMRYIDLNVYYGKQYRDHAEIMKIIIYMCVPIIILSIVAQKGLLSANIVAVIVAIITVIGVLFLISRISSAINRDNMNYDRINWYFDPDAAPEEEDEEGDDASNPWESSISTTCIGQACCDTNATYDSDKNICVVNVDSNGATESMCNMTSEQSFGSEFSLYDKKDTLATGASLVDDKLTNYARFNKPVVTL